MGFTSKIVETPHTFRKFIESYISISDQDWAIIRAKLSHKTYQKGALLLKNGTVCHHLSFLETGLLRFFIWRDGEAVTKFFTEAPYMFTSQRSFNERQPSRENIEALEDSSVWQITYTDQQELLQLPIWKAFAHKITQEVQFFTENILEELQNETAENRYRLLLNNRPELVGRVSLKHLASYLGVTQQSLSRIRRNISQ